MPLWVDTEHGAFGPYEDRRWNQILDFARIGSQHGSDREVWWGRRQPTRLLIRYEKGQRTYPESLAKARAYRLRFTGDPEYHRGRPPRRRRELGSVPMMLQARALIGMALAEPNCQDAIDDLNRAFQMISHFHWADPATYSRSIAAYAQARAEIMQRCRVSGMLSSWR